MPSPAEPGPHRDAQNAAAAIQGAVQTLRRHRDRPQLGRAATRRAVALLQAALRHGPLELQLQGAAVHCRGREVLRHGAGEGAFGALAAAGIGVLRVAPPGDAAALGQLLAVLAADHPTDDPDRDVAAALRGAGLPGISTRTATAGQTGRADGAPAWFLPAAAPRFAALAALAERDREANLPLLVARGCLADLAHDPAAGQPLEALLQAMLQRGDTAAAAWLLDQAGTAAGPELAQRLHAAATSHCSRDWLAAQVAATSAEALLALLGLCLQLGDEPLARLREAAAAHQAELPPAATALLFG